MKQMLPNSFCLSIAQKSYCYSNIYIQIEIMHVLGNLVII